ncbi:hypothetical protein ABT095_29000 [Kitasatospora sp. NPDC002227]|uniref:hypothetical protein n=1 Tax=Kitasatospora sp. NPDC002227 TaxID=3154773 RepID=UPI003328A4F4
MISARRLTAAAVVAAGLVAAGAATASAATTSAAAPNARIACAADFQAHLAKAVALEAPNAGAVFDTRTPGREAS